MPVIECRFKIVMLADKVNTANIQYLGSEYSKYTQYSSVEH